MDADRGQFGQHRRPHATEPDIASVADNWADLGQRRWLGIAAAAEATTLLLLVGVAVPLKHLGDWPLAVRILGPIHGLAFAAYLWLIIQSIGAGLLSRGVAARLVLCAFVPLAGYIAAHRLVRRTPEPFERGSGR